MDIAPLKVALGAGIVGLGITGVALSTIDHGEPNTGAKAAIFGTLGATLLVASVLKQAPMGANLLSRQLGGAGRGLVAPAGLLGATMIAAHGG
jgi:hypothetical protein